MPPARPDSGVKPSFPQQGGEALLPDKIREELSREHVVHKESLFGLARETTTLYGLHEMGAIADILKDTPPEYKQGSDLDRKVLGIAAEYTHVYENAKKQAGEEDGFIHIAGDTADFRWDKSQTQANPFICDMLDGVKEDRTVVHDMIAGPDGHTPNKQFLDDLTHHGFGDRGEAAGSLFKSMGDVSDANTPGVTEHQARQAGETAQAFAQYMLDHQKDMGEIAQNRPGLLQGAAELEKHYIPAMLGEQGPHVPLPAGAERTLGFTPLDDGGKYEKTRALFQIFDSDPESKKSINQAAAAHEQLLRADYAKSIVDDPRHAHSQSLTRAAELEGIANRALVDEGTAEGKNKQTAQQDARKDWGAAFDVGKKTAGTIADALLPPTVGKPVKFFLDQLDKWGKDPAIDVINGKPITVPDSGVPIYDTSVPQLQVLQALSERPGGLPDNDNALDGLKEAGIVDSSGHLVSPDQLRQLGIRREDLESDLKHFWENSGYGTIVTDVSLAATAYDHITDPAKTDEKKQ